MTSKSVWTQGPCVAKDDDSGTTVWLQPRTQEGFFLKLLYWDSGSLHSSCFKVSKRDKWNYRSCFVALAPGQQHLNENDESGFLKGKRAARVPKLLVLCLQREQPRTKWAEIKSRGLNSASVITRKIDDLLARYFITLSSGCPPGWTENQFDQSPNHVTHPPAGHFWDQNISTYFLY